MGRGKKINSPSTAPVSHEGNSKERVRKREKKRFVDEGAYQVDLVVAFFAVLLILLMVSSPQIIKNVKQPGKLQYRPKDLASDTFFIRSFASTYPYRNIWVMKSGQVFEVDMLKISRRYANSETVKYAEDIRGTSLKIIPEAGVIDAYSLEIKIAKAGLPEEIVKNHIPIKQTGEVTKALLKYRNGALIYLWEDQASDASAVVRNLRKAGHAHKVVLIKEDIDTIYLERNARDYEAEKILRVY